MNFVKEGSYKSKKQETYQKTNFSCHNRPKYGNTFNGYYFLVITLVTKHWNARVLKRKIQEGPITQ
jgi:hypothetical protein